MPQQTSTRGVGAADPPTAMLLACWHAGTKVARMLARKLLACWHEMMSGCNFNENTLLARVAGMLARVAGMLARVAGMLAKLLACWQSCWHAGTCCWHAGKVVAGMLAKLIFAAAHRFAGMLAKCCWHAGKVVAGMLAKLLACHQQWSGGV